MRTVKLALHAAKIIAVPVLAGVVTWAGPTGSAATALSRTALGGTATSFTVSGNLNGVAATSASDAWAVGTDGSNTLIAHGNGTAWKQVPSPNPAAPVHTLAGVAATSTTNAWAVGNTSAANGTNPKTLIARWNGTAWRQNGPSP